ncbi:hypothetical protein MB02_11820 [Croceicoccus estronivorus]|nr:hypothetical protein MB02_11820 [Croceicoccus estronivorus]
MAATSVEVGNTPLHRRLLDKPVVLYRTRDNLPVALFDRCPHRGYPLSAGILVGDNIQCGYHGLEFSPGGGCELIPSGGQTPAGMKVRSYPVADAWGWVWIWMGDPHKADREKIPDLGIYGFGREGWFVETAATFELRANYLLPFENLLDATHITFLHNGQIDTGEVAGKPLEMVVEKERILVIRRIENELQSPLTMRTFAFNGDRAHRTITAEAVPPNLCGIKVELEPVEKSAVERQINQLVVAITPQDRTNTLQFTAVAQTFPFVNPRWREELRDLLNEDVAAMEKIQALHDSIPREEAVEFGIHADKGAYRARSMIARMLRDETTSPSATGEQNA